MKALKQYDRNGQKHREREVCPDKSELKKNIMQENKMMAADVPEQYQRVFQKVQTLFKTDTDPSNPPLTLLRNPLRTLAALTDNERGIRICFSNITAGRGREKN